MQGVADAAVIGVPDDRLGGSGPGFVVGRPGSVLDEATVIAYTREHLANFQSTRSLRLRRRVASQRGWQGAQNAVARDGLDGFEMDIELDGETLASRPRLRKVPGG